MNRFAPRIIWLAHSSPGRLRLRLPWLRSDRIAAAALADHLAALPGIIEVAVRPRTGSVLCRYDDARTNAAALIAAARRRTAVTTVLRAGDRVPDSLRPAVPRGSSVARELARVMHGFDLDITEASGGHLDLGAVAGLALLAAGAAEVTVTRQLPAPPWFSLAWWAFRTFTMFEHPNEAATPASSQRQQPLRREIGSGPVRRRRAAPPQRTRRPS